MPDAGENKIGNETSRRLKPPPAMNQATPDAETSRPRSSLLVNYKPGTSVFDELVVGDGLRPHYAGLMQGLDDLGVAELKRRDDTCKRLVHEQGITYNVYGDPRGTERPWHLDPIPFI